MVGPGILVGLGEELGKEHGAELEVERVVAVAASAGRRHR